MQIEQASLVESLAKTRVVKQRDSDPYRGSYRPKADAGTVCPGTAPGCDPLAASCPPVDPGCPAWWILHRLASPQPFPVALPASAAPMVGDRTWRPCRRSARP
ncbi:hypothetical protein GCM10028813_36740 [Ramlibacter alkalitolerans]